MLRHKNTNFISELQNYFSSNEKAITTLFQYLRSLKIFDSQFQKFDNGIINQSNLARISGINESLMRQYVSGIKRATPRTLSRVQTGLRRYSETLRKVEFA